jgi:hypothetical protein
MYRPVPAAVLTILGGLLILAVGAIIALVGVFVLFFAAPFAGFFFVGVVVGALLILDGILMLVVPSLRVVWGILAIVLGVVSLPFALGGLLIGFLLVLVGGLLAMARGPRVPVTTARRVEPPGPS